MNTLKRHRRSTQGLDRNTAERMFVGLAADDAPPDYAAVAAVLAAASAPADGSSAAPGEHAAVRAYLDVVYTGAPARSARRFQPWRTAAGRLAVFATAGALAIGGGVAAAATGSLPAPAQRVAHHILGGLGVPQDVTPDAIPANLDRPDGETDATTAPGLLVRASVRTPSLTTTEVIPADAPESTTDPSETADTNDQNDANDHGQAVSSVAQSAEPGPDHGTAVCIIASRDACLAGNHEASDSTADRRSDTGAENSTKSHRSTSGTTNSANEHRSEKGAENSTKSHRPGNGATNSSPSDDDTADDDGTAKQGRDRALSVTPTHASVR